MLTLLLALILAPSEPMTIEHAKCLTAAAKDFETSGESASDIAIAVVNLCRSFEPKPSASNVLGQLSDENQRSVMVTLRSTMRDNVIFFIVNYRTCENRKGCDLNALDPVVPSKALEYMAGPIAKERKP